MTSATWKAVKLMKVMLVKLKSAKMKRLSSRSSQLGQRFQVDIDKRYVRWYHNPSAIAIRYPSIYIRGSLTKHLFQYDRKLIRKPCKVVTRFRYDILPI
jgi:hypothetical protein